MRFLKGAATLEEILEPSRERTQKGTYKRILYKGLCKSFHEASEFSTARVTTETHILLGREKRKSVHKSWAFGGCLEPVHREEIGVMETTPQ